VTGVFPLPAVVGGEDLALALLLCAVDPRIGGVLLRGEKGSAKTTVARGLAAVLPGDAPFVELPLGATEERVVGSLDLRSALGGGEYRFQPGLLAEAHGGVLYVDEVNLLADHLVDVLLDAAGGGVNRVERDGVSHVHPSRFVLVGSMNPEEGELRPQLLDRFGLSVAATAPAAPSDRAEAVRRRLAFDADPAGFRSRWEEAESALRRRVAAAAPAPLAPGLVERVARLCSAAGAQGLRADLTICRAAAALAGWEGAAEAGEAEVRRVAPLALQHRRSTPFSATVADVDDLLDEVLGAGDRPSPVGAPSVDGASSPVAGPPPDSRAVTAPEPRAGPEPEAPSPGPGSPEPEPGSLRRGLLDLRGRARQPQAAGRRSSAAPGGTRGRLVGARVPDPGSGGAPVALGATVAAAAARWAADGPPVRAVEPGDLRQGVLHHQTANLVVLVVDTSGSMGSSARVAAARTAVLSLLTDAYQRRDRVALVTFAGRSAKVVLRPTGSTEVARARLEAVTTGGTTPLAAGIRTGLAVAAGAGGYRPLLVVVSDGRATWAGGGEDPVAASLGAAAEVRRAGVGAVVVDCERGKVRLGLASRLAAALGGDVVRTEATELSGELIAGAVRGAVIDASPGPDG
jgi:magnesium chelatase subunit D